MGRKQKQKQLRFEIPQAMHDAIKVEAAKRRTTVAALMRSQITELPIFKPKRVSKRPVRKLIK